MPLPVKDVVLLSHLVELVACMQWVLEVLVILAMAVIHCMGRLWVIFP